MEEHPSQTRFVSNTSSRTILDTINDLFLKATRADCAVAHLSYEGWRLIRPMLMQWANNSDRRLRLLVRQDDQFPDKQAVTELNQIGNVEIRLFPGANFHAKQWLFFGEKLCVLTGSANLTKNGLFNNTEANVLTESPLESPESSSVIKNFESWWSRGVAVPKASTGVSPVSAETKPSPQTYPNGYDLSDFKPNGFDEISATMEINGRNYYCFLRQLKGTGLDTVQQGIKGILSEIWNVEEPLVNIKRKLGVYKEFERKDQMSYPALMSVQCFGKFTDQNRFSIFASGTHESIATVLPIIFNECGLDENWSISNGLNSEKMKRGDRKAYFACPAIQIMYKNKIPHTYLGIQNRFKLDTMSTEDILRFALSFNKHAIEDPKNTQIDSVIKISEGGGDNLSIPNCDPKMATISFSQTLDGISFNCFAKVVVPKGYNLSVLKAQAIKHFTGVNRNDMRLKCEGE